jgi:hypothetical protein
MDTAQGNTRSEGRVLLHFRPAELDYKTAECRGEVVSLSAWNFVMRSPIRLQTDSLLSLRMFIPIEISGSAFCETRGTGRVVCERRLQDGTPGYLIQIELVFFRHEQGDSA